MNKPSRPLPKPTPETQDFWDGCKKGELRLQRCDSCSHTYFPPRPFCPACSSRSVSSFAASGKATLASYVINHRPHPAFGEPHSIAIVDLAEGPRMATNVTGCAQTPEALVLDMPLKVKFESVSDDITLPLFEPNGDAS
ncbi:MAG: OB-fold domain-containing protein [Pseudomonadota bacterium]|nr:OB-fold domain-containing protein [Pseudomonadota bacterium]